MYEVTGLYIRGGGGVIYTHEVINCYLVIGVANLCRLEPRADLKNR